MRTFNLVDTFFPHIEYSAPGVKSDIIKWDRQSKIGTVFYTHEQILYGPSEFNSGVNYGLLIESQGIIPNIYKKLVNNSDLVKKFNRVFTHSSHLLQKYNNTLWIPGGSIWVGGSYGGGEIKLYEKTKNCSLVSSDKRMCPLHNYRIAIAELLEVTDKNIDIYGTLNKQWIPIIETLQDYRFSIIIENFIDDEYFTEKLLNCFATGTIPIYHGARNIGKHFNLDGIIRFDKPADLLCILTSLSSELYRTKYDAVVDNFERCQKFRLLEDYIVSNYEI